MKSEINQPDDGKLGRLLREGRPEASLPPGFQEAVWRRIARVERDAGASSWGAWLDGMVSLLMRPRLAMMAVVLLLFFGGGLGAVQGLALSKQQAQERYVAAVSPTTTQP